MTESSGIHITVDKREGKGKEAAGRLRREGKVPAVVYGGDRPPVPIIVDEERVKELLKQEAGENTIFLLKLKGSSDERRAMIRELQVDPISGQFLHIDFIRVVKGHKLQVSMPVELTGDSIGVRHGGRVDFVSRSLQVEVLPREMFGSLTIDVSELDIGDNVTVADLEEQLPESARFVEDEGRVVVVVALPRAIVEEEEEEEELITAEEAEPEVIGKGREEAEEEEPSEG